MRIALVDVDSHNFPNIPLMKLSTHHKSLGDTVEMYVNGKEYDIAYLSKVFTESKEPIISNCKSIIRGGGGYDLINKLAPGIESCYPDYSIYPQFDFATGMLTRGCPMCKHTFCITPIKDGVKSVKVADLSDFWRGQSKIVLLDQNILACKDSINLLNQLKESKVEIEFNGGIDIRLVTEEVIEILRGMKIKDYHFAWDDPRENLVSKFKLIKDSGLKNTNQIGVYVLTNFWSSIEEDLYRIYALRSMGFMPFVMIFDKQKYVDKRGRWLSDVCNKFTKEQLTHFKVTQHLQRWCGNRKLIKVSPNFNDYKPYVNWVEDGMNVPSEQTQHDQISMF